MDNFGRFIKRISGNNTGGVIPNYPSALKDMGMGIIAYQYQYVNPPPLAHGTPAPKVIESVVRSWEYNKLPNRGLDVPTQMWTKRTGYPFRETTSNFSPWAGEQMSKLYLKENFKEIDSTLNKTLYFYSTTNSDILTKGRQTWDPINLRSVPASQAYKIAEETLRRNYPEMEHTLEGFVEGFQRCLSLDRFEYRRKEIVVERINQKRTRYGMPLVKRRKVVRNVDVIVEGNDKVRKLLIGWATSFCSYLKSKERGKEKTRAIASANMFLRALLLVTEEFHLELGKKVPGSTISLGGEDKKEKILETISLEYFLKNKNSESSQNDNWYGAQATEDASKWNECIAPEMFALMHEVFTKNSYRAEMNLPELGAEINKLRKMFRFTFYLLSKKRVHLMQGPLVESEHYYTRIEWKQEYFEEMNTETQLKWEQVKDKVDEEGYLHAPFGFLMGMLNAGSTTLGLIAINWRSSEEGRARCVRSSDDSMTLFESNSEEGIIKEINRVYSNYKLIGINVSEKKNRVFRPGVGEYTSWYMDQNFFSQFGVELSALRPSAQNPPDDFHSAAIQTVQALKTNSMNFVGARMALALRINNVRNLWRIERKLNKWIEVGVPDEVVVLSDGGPSPWSMMNCHIPEIELKKRLIGENENSKKYLEIIMNPINPFTSESTTKTTYSIEKGSLVESTVEIPRNLFHYMKRSNRTEKAINKVSENRFTKACGLTVELIDTAYPPAIIRNPVGKESIKDFLKFYFETGIDVIERNGGEWTEEEAALVNQAREFLED